MKYELRATKRFDRTARRLSPEAFEHVLGVIYQLETQPRLGEPLKGEFKGWWALHVVFQGTQYRVVYTIRTEQQAIDLHYAGTREKFYQQLRRAKLKVA